MIEQSAPRPLRIRLVALPETTPSSLYSLLEVLSAVGTIWPEMTGEPPAGRLFDVAIIAQARDPLTCALGVTVTPQLAFHEPDQADIAIVTDLAVDPAHEPRGRWPEAAEWLRRQYAGGATICSVCTGSLLLAGAGLLDGLEATTHWSAAEQFARCFPDVILRPERILVPAGTEHRVVTSGGAASWEELALYLITRFSSPEEAVRAAKLFVLGDRSEGQLPFATLGRPKSHEDAVIADAQTWLADNYDQAFPVAAMVARAGLPERTFARRFKAATGYAPVDYVQALRIEEAKQLLETSDTATDLVGMAVGYDDPAHFRRLFKRRTGTTPSRYRQRFQGLTRQPGTA
ncbi:AraC family transcriptional regulator with amidase-like domain [Dongia mobilis]|uniref:AraC family transcriptional regulator with amidase-like domain n=1 Tax=Dongia mobilis TaxID=578943 RepID=A0A4R6WRD5_9PROT|nr:helix-turn-helix domain-containing protein [Dongia mobilis]TDQ81357.1 AraC family transcriptional regulator with amidase-like domain [Dongia mobilis]